MVPIEIAWRGQYIKNPIYIFFNFLLDFIFFLDIFIKFNTTFINKKGEEVNNRKKIV